MYSSYDPVSANIGNTNNKVRTPRGFVSINGTQVFWKRATINNTRYAAASTFSVTIPISTLPKNMPLATLLTTGKITVQINAGNSTATNPNTVTASDLPMLILGDADDIAYDPKQSLITLTGRDYVSYFIENKINNNLFNTAGTGIDIRGILSLGVDGVQSPSSSEIISKIATARNLTPFVTRTATPFGAYLNNPQNQYTMLSTNSTEWDLMTFLAREEGFDLFVLGNNLYFQPKDESNPYRIVMDTPFFSTPGEIPNSNVTEIQFKRNMRLSKDIIVNVYTYDVYKNKQLLSTATLSHNNVTDDGVGDAVYNFVFPSLTQAQANNKARQLLLDISQHEMEIDFTMPADEIITAHSVISVIGTNTAFDQNYYVNNIMRELDYQTGYLMTVNAKNQSPYTLQAQ
ncbi:hypothetical protein AQUSIP_12860 [Aquicella siphonis]|uniref:Uncharacterized protein n=1 Tax=Aquicella siphonis TaxID=254247 RepID=A0A5E4PHB3_9COXI|nr:hypothetical protein [Aquicella siphonis]VVC75985.1 hypothetical protein AQUSIP_12860 [Aquicella siphonis]